jgi:hypothetical protein
VVPVHRAVVTRRGLHHVDDKRMEALGRLIGKATPWNVHTLISREGDKDRRGSMGKNTITILLPCQYVRPAVGVHQNYTHKAIRGRQRCPATHGNRAGPLRLVDMKCQYFHVDCTSFSMQPPRHVLHRETSPNPGLHRAPNES